MKKTLLSVAAFLLFSIVLNAQTTYYWKAGSTEWSTGWWTGTGGTGTQRPVLASNANAATDILIFNTGTTVTVNAVQDSCAQLLVTSNTTVNITSVTAPTAATGTITSGTTYSGCVVPITGSGTNFLTDFAQGDYIESATASGAAVNQCQILNINSATSMDVSLELTTVAAFNASIFYKVPALKIQNSLTVDVGSTLTIGASSSTGIAGYAIILIRCYRYHKWNLHISK